MAHLGDGCDSLLDLTTVSDGCDGLLDITYHSLGLLTNERWKDSGGVDTNHPLHVSFTSISRETHAMNFSTGAEQQQVILCLGMGSLQWLVAKFYSVAGPSHPAPGPYP